MPLFHKASFVRDQRMKRHDLKTFRDRAIFVFIYGSQSSEEVYKDDGNLTEASVQSPHCGNSRVS